eukprot:12400332-Karenia_brevis.AAC.1
MRRVVDSSASPFKKCWRLIARAARGALRACKLGSEVFDITQAGGIIREKCANLVPSLSPCCLNCKKPLTSITIMTADIDQAYEAIDSAKFQPAWSFVQNRFAATFGDHILVRGCKREVTKPAIPKKGFPAGWYKLSMQEISLALSSYCLASLAVVCGLVFKVSGLLIGGLASSICLSVVLAVAEQ